MTDNDNVVTVQVTPELERMLERMGMSLDVFLRAGCDMLSMSSAATGERIGWWRG